MSNSIVVREHQEVVAHVEPAGVPAIISGLGDDATLRFVEFFTARIENPNTQAAYYRAAMRFLRWAEEHRLALHGILPPHLAAYLKELGQYHAKATVKQHLASIRMLFDWLVVGQVIPQNPATSVRGPKLVATTGKTPAMIQDEARHLLNSIDGEDVVSLRDRALLAVLLYSVSRVSATLAMNVEDYFPQGKRWWFRLHEKGGKHHAVPAHHKAEEYMDTYLHAAGLVDETKAPLFRKAVHKTKQLSPDRMTRRAAYAMIRRRCKHAGIAAKIGCHSCRATGITDYLNNGGTLEKARHLAAHASTKTTMLYDRRAEQVSLDEVERIAI